MYIFPGYVKFYQKETAIYLTSELLQNKVKITDPALQREFLSMVEAGGCQGLCTALTQFLHEQEMLVDEDEINSAFKQAIGLLDENLLLTIMPTDACNFRCKYCYEAHEPQWMSKDTIERIKEYIASQVLHFKYVVINWFGGEPTLCKDVVLEVSNFVQSLCSGTEIQYISNMTTNGYLLDCNNLLEYYRAGISGYQITLDGWNHDCNRPHISGKGTLDTITKNLNAISSLPQTYQFHITLRHNILAGDKDFSWYDYLYKLFGKDSRFSISVNPVNDWGGDSVQELSLVTKREAGLVASHIDYADKIGMKVIRGDSGPFSKICYASYPYGFVFRSSGKIEKCTVCLDHPKNQIGYVDRDRGVIIDASANALWTHTELKQECYTCPDILRWRCGRLTIVEGNTTARCHHIKRGL